mgnify:CR=1 FL=1
MDAGDVYVADLGGEVRRHVLVLSNAGFHRRAARALVAPEWRGAEVDVPFPWIVTAEDDLRFAVDHMRSVPLERLLHRVTTAPFRTVVAARRALLAIT